MKLKLIGLLILPLPLGAQDDSLYSDWDYYELDSANVHIEQIQQAQERIYDKLELLEEYFKHEDPPFIEPDKN